MHDRVSILRSAELPVVVVPAVPQRAPPEVLLLLRLRLLEERLRRQNRVAIC